MYTYTVYIGTLCSLCFDMVVKSTAMYAFAFRFMYQHIVVTLTFSDM